MRYKLMLIDCDRTLLTDKGCVTERTQKAIRDSIKRGVKVVFASGRAPSGIENIIKSIGAEGLIDYLVCFNGGMILCLKDRQAVSESILTLDDVTKISESICGDPEDYYVFTSKRLVCQGNNEQAEIEAMKNNMSLIQDDVRQLDADEKAFKMVFAGKEEKLDKIEKEIPEILRKQYNVTRSEPNNLEFISLHASKGYALKKLTDILNIRIQDTICFGDSENDLSMLKIAGTGVAMGNACEKLKSVADCVTDSNNNEGLAKAIEKLVLS